MFVFIVEQKTIIARLIELEAHLLSGNNIDLCVCVLACLWACAHFTSVSRETRIKPLARYAVSLEGGSPYLDKYQYDVLHLNIPDSKTNLFATSKAYWLPLAILTRNYHYPPKQTNSAALLRRMWRAGTCLQPPLKDLEGKLPYWLTPLHRPPCL